MQLTNKLDKTIFNLNFFRMVNLVVFIFYFVPSDSNIENIPMKITFAWGILLLAKDFFTERIMFKMPYWYILLALGISYFLSVILNYPHHFIDSAYNWIYLVTTLFLFYPVDLTQDKEEIKKKYMHFSDILIYIVFILSFISLILFIFNISYKVPTGTADVMARQGFVENRLFGLYTSPNVGALFGFVTVVLSSINNILKRGAWNKFSKIYLVNLFVQYIYYILSSSRGTQLTVNMFYLILFSLLFIQTLLSKRDIGKKIKVYALSIVVGFLMLNVTTIVIESALSYIPGTVSNLVQYEESSDTEDSSKGNDKVNSKKEKFKVEKVAIQHSEEGAEVSSGRLTIWKAGLAAMKQSPLFGLADSDLYRNGDTTNQIDESLLSDLDKNELKRAHGNMHNTYVAILVKSGIMGFIILAIFMILILKDNFIYIIEIKEKMDEPENQIFLILFSLVLALLFEDLVENHLIFNNRDVVGLVFWYSLGFMQYMRLRQPKDAFLGNRI